MADPGLKAGAFSPGSVVPVGKPGLKRVSQLELMTVSILVIEGVDGKGTKFLVKWHWIVLLSASGIFGAIIKVLNSLHTTKIIVAPTKPSTQLCLDSGALTVPIRHVDSLLD